ncbi:Uncharacterised protein [uncultured archaeon]|nr:Uncharacterised protein [uncultured archaeon]
MFIFGFAVMQEIDPKQVAQVLKQFPYELMLSAPTLGDVNNGTKSGNVSYPGLKDLWGKLKQLGGTTADVEKALQEILRPHSEYPEVKTAAGVMMVYAGLYQGGSFKFSGDYKKTDRGLVVLDEKSDIVSDLYRLFYSAEDIEKAKPKDATTSNPGIDGAMSYLRIYAPESGTQTGTTVKEGEKKQNPFLEFSKKGADIHRVLPTKISDIGDLRMLRSTMTGTYPLNSVNGGVNIPSNFFYQLGGREFATSFQADLNLALTTVADVGEFTSIMKEKIYDPANPEKQGTFYYKLMHEHPNAVQGWRNQFTASLETVLAAAANGDVSAFQKYAAPNSIFKDIQVFLKNYDLGNPEVKALLTNYSIRNYGMNSIVNLKTTQSGALQLGVDYSYSLKEGNLPGFPKLGAESHQLSLTPSYYSLDAGLMSKLQLEYEHQSSYIDSKKGKTTLSTENKYGANLQFVKEGVIPIVKGANDLIIRTGVLGGGYLKNIKMQEETDKQLWYVAGAKVEATDLFTVNPRSPSPYKVKFGPKIYYGVTTETKAGEVPQVLQEAGISGLFKYKDLFEVEAGAKISNVPGLNSWKNVSYNLTVGIPLGGLLTAKPYGSYSSYKK